VTIASHPVITNPLVVLPVAQAWVAPWVIPVFMLSKWTTRSGSPSPLTSWMAAFLSSTGAFFGPNVTVLKFIVLASNVGPDRTATGTVPALPTLIGAGSWLGLMSIETCRCIITGLLGAGGY